MKKIKNLFTKKAHNKICFLNKFLRMKIQNFVLIKLVKRK